MAAAAQPEHLTCSVCTQSVASKVAFTVRQFVACSKVCLQKLRATQLQDLANRERRDEQELYEKQQQLGVLSRVGGGGGPTA